MMITATQVGNVDLTLFVDVHVACPTFQSLMNKPVKERAALIAEGGRSVGVNGKQVLSNSLLRSSSVTSGTGE